MFGHLAAFANGNMFCGFFGADIMVRLPEGERQQLLGEEGAAPFAPMGRPMKDYVRLPRSWQSQPDRIRRVLRQSMEWAAGLPPRTAIRPKRGPLAAPVAPEIDSPRFTF